MKEIDPIAGIDHWATIKITIGKKIIDHKIIMKGIGPIAEIKCTIEIGTTPENTKETGDTVEIGHIVEIGCKATTTEMTIEMSIRRKIIGISKTRDMREGLEIIMKMHMKTGTTRIIIELATKTKIRMDTETDIEMTAMTGLGVGLKKMITYMMMIYCTQNLKECKEFCKHCVKKKK